SERPGLPQCREPTSLRGGGEEAQRVAALERAARKGRDLRPRRSPRRSGAESWRAQTRDLERTSARVGTRGRRSAASLPKRCTQKVGTSGRGGPRAVQARNRGVSSRTELETNFCSVEARADAAAR